MQALNERSGRRSRTWLWLVIAGVVVVAAAAAGVSYAVTRNDSGDAARVVCAKGTSCTATAGTQTTSARGNGSPSNSGGGKSADLKITGSTPSPGATTVPSDSVVSIRFSAPPVVSTEPTITPAVDGNWTTSGSTLVFTPTAPLVPYTKYTVSVPGGSGGIANASGGHLADTQTISFTVAPGSTLRLQQLLAQLDYLPLSYTEPTPAPAPLDMAMPQSGTLVWRWTTLPANLTSLWSVGVPNVITKGAIESFETQNGLAVDGLAGPEVWHTLLTDVITDKVDANPWTYVLVTKTLPEHLTAWINGVVQFHILVNTGVPGATTTPGTYEVFEHVTASDMKGVNVTGTAYTDPDVPWASYFNGGDALHGYPRATYGWPQSNGCVEMPITTAGKLWPYTPIGTLVTVIGPPAPQ